MGSALHRRWTGRALGALSGIALALALAELAASALHGGAFPYLTCFVPDDALGVRLAPHAVARIRSRSGRITTVRTNADGFRGAEWPREAPARERVLVLGDSQAMGLHVDDPEHLAARLAADHGIEALDAAVPTWGPLEAVAIVDELAPRARPTHALLLLNVANDWHEANVPNTRRTTARDGWAVRPELGDPPRDLPFRAFLMGGSHLVYAARVAMGRASDVVPLRGDAPHRVVEDLAWLRRAPEGFRSRLGPILADARARCERHDVELVVAILPMDVQVHAREWAKYRERPLDMRATEELARAAAADARALGLRAIDLLAILRAASPGAFLSDDPHLSPRGHAAIATAIARVVREPAMEARR